MEAQSVVQQMVDFQKSSMQIGFEMMRGMQTQQEEMVRSFYKNASDRIEDRLRVLEDWFKLVKKNQENGKAATDLVHEGMKKVMAQCEGLTHNWLEPLSLSSQMAEPSANDWMSACKKIQENARSFFEKGWNVWTLPAEPGEIEPSTAGAAAKQKKEK